MFSSWLSSLSDALQHEANSHILEEWLQARNQRFFQSRSLLKSYKRHCELAPIAIFNALTELLASDKSRGLLLINFVKQHLNELLNHSEKKQYLYYWLSYHCLILECLNNFCLTVNSQHSLFPHSIMQLNHRVLTTLGQQASFVLQQNIQIATQLLVDNVSNFKDDEKDPAFTDTIQPQITHHQLVSFGNLIMH